MPTTPSATNVEGRWALPRTFWPLLALVGSLVLTGIATALAWSGSQMRFTAAVSAAVEQEVGAVDSRMNAYLALVRGTRSFVSAEGDRLDREAFRRYVEGVGIQTNYPGIQGIGYSPRVDAERIGAFEDAARREGVPDFKYFPEGAREWAFSILYLEPLDARNRAALGYDMHSEPVRAEAMDRARDSGGFAMSGRVVLKQEIEPEKSAGFLIYTPLYQGGEVPGTVALRRERLVGFVYAPFRAADFFEDLFRNDAVVSLRSIHDGAIPSADNLLYERDVGSTTVRAVRQIAFGGQTWTLQFVDQPKAYERAGRWVPGAVAFVGLAISALLYLLARGQTSAQQRTEAQKDFLQQQVQFSEMLMGIVSHDLRNPLNVISLNAALLERADLRPEFRRSLERIHSSSDMAQRLIGDLLDFTQARLGRGIPVVRRAGDLIPIVEQAIDEAQVTHPARAIVFESHGDATGSWDPDRITQLVSNLVTNALVYGDADSPISVRVRGRQTSVVIEVHNRGEPIPQESIPELFEPLRRGRQHGRASARNIGLGLYIVRQIALAHGGTVTCHSSRAEGTTFVVELPRAA